jgi:hypothetical protein
MRVAVALGLLLIASLPAATHAEEMAGATLPEHHAADPGAAVVSAQTLLANERFWPYQVALANGEGAAGVLIRVEPGGVARIDFGRDGLREVPIAETDLLERANRIRTGELDKIAPNFLLAIGPRLVDATGERMRPVPYPLAAERQGFLCVFADPNAKDFAAIAAALAPLQDRHRVWTLLFPRAELPDAKLRDQLRALDWPVPFVYDHLAEAYSRSLLAQNDALPFVMLVTRDGRVVYESRWKADVAPDLRAALDEAFGAPTATTAELSPP